MTAITAYFGIFGERGYPAVTDAESEAGAAQIPCRWCVGEGDPTRPNCTACKNTRKMWIGL